jgi:hypothetical protein
MGEENDMVAPSRSFSSVVVDLARMFHEPDFAGSFLFRGLYFVDLARV